jgi:ABC-2 type transport system ATP-binding protein
VSAPELVVEARGVTRRFGSLVAVDGIDLEIERGEVFGFLGPNGAGKSTLIRMLTGLLEPSGGQVRVLGLELPRQVERLRSRIGYMTQRFSLYEDLSVEENLEFVSEVFGLGRSVRRSRIAEALDDHELAARRRQRAGTLSGGWKQRLALAAATIHHPELLFLDEPTAGVDPDRRRAFWEKLFELAAHGTTILVSTHYMDEAVRCHRLGMVRAGKRAALGSPAELTAALEGRVIEVVTDRPEPVIAELRTFDDVASVAQMGDTVHVLVRPDGPPAVRAAALLREVLQGRGVSRVDLKPASPNLEDVFVALALGERFGPGSDDAEPAPEARPTPPAQAPPVEDQAPEIRPEEARTMALPIMLQPQAAATSEGSRIVRWWRRVRGRTPPDATPPGPTRRSGGGS